MFNNFHNRVVFGTILEDLLNFGGGGLNPPHPVRHWSWPFHGFPDAVYQFLGWEIKLACESFHVPPSHSVMLSMPWRLHTQSNGVIFEELKATLQIVSIIIFRVFFLDERRDAVSVCVLTCTLPRTSLHSVSRKTSKRFHKDHTRKDNGRWRTSDQRRGFLLSVYQFMTQGDSRALKLPT